MMLAGRAADLPLLVRVADGSGPAIQSALDLGAAGVVVPHVDSAEQARRVVAHARFEGGDRGFSISARFAGYGTLARARAVAEGDASLVVCQIESAAAVESAAAIAAVPGVAALFIGRADLALSMGIGDPRDPRVDAATQRVLDAARAAGKAAAIFVGDIGEVGALAARGGTCFVVGSDQSLLRQAALGLKAPQRAPDPGTRVAPGPVREREFRVFGDDPGQSRAGNRHRLYRGQNFAVEWIEVGAAAQPFEAASAREFMLLLPTTGATLARPLGSATSLHAGARSLCIVPAGACSVTLDAAGSCAVITSLDHVGPAGPALNAASYRVPDPRIAPAASGAYRRRSDVGGITVIAIDDVAAPKDNPRLKMFQCCDLSINWVEYEAPRDRSALSPHSHATFEQGSLAIAGDFVHHLRVEWGRNADHWRDDEHLRAPSPSLLVVPVGMIHTTEGVGPGRHVLVDVFSPPRADFIAKGWVDNAGDYVPEGARPTS
jgi:2-keto-3-deoxy-L-rhamnonate aldolase RhmA